MKCPNCGGEVESTEAKCPYCQTIMPSGVYYQDEMERKMRRIKLLKPFMMKEIAPQAVSKVLNNTLLVMVFACFIFLFISFLISAYIYNEPKGKEPTPGSYQERYVNYDYSEFVRYRTAAMNSLDDEKEFDDFYIEYSIWYGFKAFEGHEDEIEAYFRGYLCFDDELMDEFLTYFQEKTWEYDTKEYFAQKAMIQLEKLGYTKKY